LIAGESGFDFRQGTVFVFFIVSRGFGAYSVSYNGGKGFSLGLKRLERAVGQFTYLSLVLKLRMSGVIPPSSIHSHAIMGNP
jgi:hypothetical protein